MSDDKLDHLLKRLNTSSVNLEPANFQTKVWAQLDTGKSYSAAFSGLGKILALRAVPAAVALLVGGAVGATMIPSAGEQDLLAVFETDSEWSITTLVSEEDPS